MLKWREYIQTTGVFLWCDACQAPHCDVIFVNTNKKWQVSVFFDHITSGFYSGSVDYREVKYFQDKYPPEEDLAAIETFVRAYING